MLKLNPYKTNRPKLSEVAGRTADGQPTCPKCGGTQFTAKRSGRGKMRAGLLAPKTEVACVTCGTHYSRG